MKSIGFLEDSHDKLLKRLLEKGLRGLDELPLDGWERGGIRIDIDFFQFPHNLKKIMSLRLI